MQTYRHKDQGEKYMKTVWSVLILYSAMICASVEHDIRNSIPQVPETTELIASESERHAYFGAEVCSIIHDFPVLHEQMIADKMNSEYVSLVCDYIVQGYATVSLAVMEAALREIIEYLDKKPAGTALEYQENIVEYYRKIQSKSSEVVKDVPINFRLSKSCTPKTYRFLQVCTLLTQCLKVSKNLTVEGSASVTGNETVGGNLTVNGNELIGKNLTIQGNETILGNLTVNGTIQANVTPVITGSLELIGAPQQACIIFVDSSLTEKARICSSPIVGDKGVFVSVDDGVTQNLRVNNAGGTTLAAPSSGSALSVTGNTGSSAAVITGAGTAGALTLIGNQPSQVTDLALSIDTVSGVIRQGPGIPGTIVNGCQSGPLSIGTSDATTLTFATNGCSNSRLSIDADGTTTIAAPSSGVALSVTGNVGASAITATGNSTPFEPTLTLIGNPASASTDFLLTIDNTTGVVKQAATPIGNFIVKGCQTGPLSIGTSDATTLTLATNGCTSRLSIDQNGATTIAAPSSGVALSVTGNTGASAITTTGNSTTTAPALTLVNNPASASTDFLLTIDNATGVVKQAATSIGTFIVSGCQTGPLSIGTSDATTLTLATNGCSNSRLSINSNGATTIAAPSLGAALSVTGNSGASAITATGDSTTTAPALQLVNNPASIAGDVLLAFNSATGAVTQSTDTVGSLVIKGCQTGPLSIGTSDGTTLTLATNGCSNSRLSIDQNGATTIAAPSSGIALSVTGNTGASAMTATGNGTTTAPALRLVNNPASAISDFLLTIDNTTGVVKQAATSIGTFIVNGCQTGPLSIGTSNATTLALATNGCSNSRLSINSNGATTIAAPSAGAALSVTGNTGASAITATGNSTTTAPTLTLIGNPASASTDFLLTIDNTTGVVKQAATSIGNFIVNGCQTGPLSIGTNNATTLTLATNGCTSRLSIDQNGATTIAAPSTAEVALSVTGNVGASAITATGNSTTTAPALTLIGNPASASTDFLLTIDDITGAVKQAATSIGNFIVNGCQTGPLSIGTSDATTLTLATNGCSNGRLSIDSNGAVTIATPAAAETGLTITGGGEIITAGSLTMTAGNVILTAVTPGVGVVSSGLLGMGASTTGMSMFEAGTRNSFAGRYASNIPNVSGTDNISIGTNANSTLTTANKTIAIGANAATTTLTATTTDSIVIGDGANTTTGFARAVVIGSKDSTSTGLAPTAGALNEIVIGSSHGTIGGAGATGVAAVAIGGAGTNGAGAEAAGTRSLAIGAGSVSAGNLVIALGSCSGVGSGFGPEALGGAIAIGSANNNKAGPTAFGSSGMAIGGSDGTTVGAQASGTRSVAIGNGAITAQSDAIVLGNPTAAALLVGIGTSLPTARLHVVGPTTAPVFRLSCGASTAAAAPVIDQTTLFTATTGTPLQYNTTTGVISQTTSSKRFKENFRPMGTLSKGIYTLNPLIYDMKPENGGDKNQPGFIAEEVAEIFPSLISYNQEGKVQAIKYDGLHALAIKEIQEHQQILLERDAFIQSRSSILDALLVKLTNLKIKIEQIV